MYTHTILGFLSGEKQMAPRYACGIVIFITIFFQNVSYFFFFIHTRLREINLVKFCILRVNTSSIVDDCYFEIYKNYKIIS